MIPILHIKSDFSGEGAYYYDYYLSDAINCFITEERNGAYTLEMEYLHGGAHENDIEVGQEIEAETADGTTQFFDIITVNRQNGRNTVIEARHRSYRYAGIPVRINRSGVWLTARSAQEALENCKSYIPNPYDGSFSVFSDVETIADWKPERPASYMEMLMSGDNSIIEKFGGELWFYTDKENRAIDWVKLLKSRGADNGVTIRYAKNITDINSEITIEGSYNGVYPYWSKGDSYYYPSSGTKIENSNIHYDVAKIVDFTADFETRPTYAQLLAAAQAITDGKDIDQLSIAVSLSTGYTDGFNDVSNLEHVALCDTVTVIYEPFGIDVKTKVVKTVYDVLLSRLDSVEIGTVKQTLADAIANSETRGGNTYITGGGADYEERIEALETTTATLASDINNLSLTNIGATKLGSVGTSQSTITLPHSTAAYIIVTTHNSTTNNNGMWIVRGASGVFKIGGGSNITITKNNATLTVKSSSGNSDLYAIRLG